MHLGDDDALGAVDDEGAVRRHEGHVAHVDVLLLDVLDGLGLGVGIHIEHDETQRHLEGRGEGHAALAALIDVILGLLEFVFDEFQQGRLREVGDRENGFEDGLKPLVRAPALGLIDEQELVVGRLLNLNQVRHLRHFPDMSEKLADPLTTGERLSQSLSHVAPLTSSNRRAGGPRPSRAPTAQRKIGNDPIQAPRTARHTEDRSPPER